jgi:hypothetical protein
MASAHLIGDAVIKYTPPGGSEVTHKLAVPLLVSPAQGFGAARRRMRWESWSPSGQTRTVFRLEDSTDEITATIRFDDEPDELLTLLAYALEENLTLTYIPESSGTEYPLMLVALDGAGADTVTVRPDRDRWAHAEYEAGPMLLRRVDGGSLAALLEA